jgi:hypothetical protein
MNHNTLYTECAEHQVLQLRVAVVIALRGSAFSRFTQQTASLYFNNIFEYDILNVHPAY